MPQGNPKRAAQISMVKRGKAFSTMLRISKTTALPVKEQRLDKIKDLLRVLVFLVGQRVRNTDSNTFPILIRVVRHLCRMVYCLLLLSPTVCLFGEDEREKDKFMHGRFAHRMKTMTTSWFS